METTLAHNFVGRLKISVCVICLEQCLTYYEQLLPIIYLDEHMETSSGFIFFFIYWLLDLRDIVSFATHLLLCP